MRGPLGHGVLGRSGWGDRHLIGRNYLAWVDSVNTEQSGGFVVLLLVALAVGALVPMTLPPEPQDRACQMTFEYTGRSDAGRPQWHYGRKCYE